MIRTRSDMPLAAAAPAADATAATGSWDIDTLPPELDYFRRSEAYQVELSGFQGPMDLLLYLIQKDEIDIYDIPISRLTEQFIRHIEVMQAVALDQAGEFMAMAATLLVIKMKMLMPRPAEAGEEPEEADPRAELVRRLLEYKRFKEAARALQACEDERARYHVRQTPYPFLATQEFEPQLRLEIFDLLSALAAVLDRVQAVPVHHVLREPFTVEEKIVLIQAAVRQQAAMRFEEFFRHDAIRMEVIVTFIAILELVRRGELKVFQTELRGPLWVQARQEQAAAAAGEAEL